MSKVSKSINERFFDIALDAFYRVEFESACDLAEFA